MESSGGGGGGGDSGDTVHFLNYKFNVFFNTMLKKLINVRSYMYLLIHNNIIINL